MYSIGIDVGGTNLKVGLLDENSSLLAHFQKPLFFTTEEAFVATLVAMSQELLERQSVPQEQIASVGIGFPGAVDVRLGRVVALPNIPVRDLPVVEMFQRQWQIPVHLGNDADCAAWGEYYCSRGERPDSLVLVTIGTGIGTGIILNGKIWSGYRSCAGEGGHMVIIRNGQLCGCGRHGCWEQYASATALIRQTCEAMERHPESLLWQVANGDLSAVNGKTAFDAKQLGDPTAACVLDQYIGYLGEGITNLFNILQPELVVLGGGVSLAKDEDLLHPLRDYVEKRCYGGYSCIRRAALGNQAGVIGAGLLGLQTAGE